MVILETLENKVAQKGGYLAYVLDEASRNAILELFVPKYSKVIAEHMTYTFPAKMGEELPPSPSSVKIVGYKDKQEGIEAVVVEVDGNATRPDGKLFHITLSLEPDKKKPSDSNILLADGYVPLCPYLINVFPAHLK